MAGRVQILTSIDVGLRALGVCLVGSVVTTSPAWSHPLPYASAFHYDPLSTTSFPQRSGLEELAVPFTPELRHQYGIDISCIPFSMSPIPIPEVMKSLSLPQIELPGSVAFDPKSVDFAMVR